MTDHYAVIGNPIAHSQSPRIHALFAIQTKQNMTYKAIPSPVDGFDKCVADLIKQGYKGLNVTAPFKLEAFKLASELSLNAQMAGSANTLTIDASGNIHADNTDGLGLLRDLIINHDIDIASKRLLILGAGGAVRGILSPILLENPACVHIANRTVEKAEALAKTMQSQTSVIDTSCYEDIPEEPFDLIINGTSASIDGRLPYIPDACVGANTCCYDMMYSPKTTIFQAWSRERGVEKALDGLGMLVEQAAYSFQIWRTIRPDTMRVYDAIRQAIKRT